jgi:hypothetical protein
MLNTGVPQLFGLNYTMSIGGLSWLQGWLLDPVQGAKQYNRFYSYSVTDVASD